MEPNENTTGAGHTSGAQLTPEVPGTAVGNGAQADSQQPHVDGMTLAELNELTGKNFPTRDAALKSIKDTFSYVGKKTEDIKKEVLAELASSDKTDKLATELEEMRKERFFDKNPQYANPEIRELITKIGGNPAEVVETPAFKAVFEKIQGYEEVQKSRTVLDSNPRLASSVDSLSKAKEIAMKGGQNSEEVESLVAGAIKDAFNM